MKAKIITPLLIIALIAGVMVWQKHKQAETAKHDAETAARLIEQAPKLPGINGIELTESLATRRPIAAIIENHPDSRPQSGLSEADILYETLAEGGITRFLALYQSKDPKEIGPIRSTRPYFNFLANQWSPLFAHAGGSQTALQQLRIGYYRGISDADEMLNGNYYYRESSKFPPHNLFSSSEKLRQLIEDRKLDNWEQVSIFQYRNIPTHELATSVTEVTIPFSTASYIVKYTFDPETNSYYRTNGGKAAIDKNNNAPIVANNIIVQFTEGSLIPDDPTLAMQYRLDRSGKGYLFLGGKVTAISWKNVNGNINYLDNAGNPLMIQPGPIYIAIVPSYMQNNVTWK